MNFKLKTAGLIAGIAGLTVLTSAVSSKNVPLEVGNHVPEISICNADGQSFLLSDLEGEDVVVNFWSVKDAESRIRNIRLASDAERNGVRYVGLCTDEDHDLAVEVMRADGLQARDQYFTDPRINEGDLTKRGVGTIKIDPYGIVADID